MGPGKYNLVESWAFLIFLFLDQNKLLYKYSWIVAPYIMRKIFFNA